LRYRTRTSDDLVIVSLDIGTHCLINGHRNCNWIATTAPSICVSPVVLAAAKNGLQAATGYGAWWSVPLRGLFCVELVKLQEQAIDRAQLDFRQVTRVE
jgi:multidrug transporter EmrE-like cation transporter